MTILTIAELLTNKGESARPMSNCRLDLIPIKTTEPGETFHRQECLRPEDIIGCDTITLNSMFCPPFNPDNPAHLSYIHRGFCNSATCDHSGNKIPNYMGH